MPSKSKAQHKLMAAIANNPKFAKKAGIPQNVGADYMKADKKVKKYNRGGVMAHDKKEIRNLNDESYRIRNNKGGNAAAERRRIDGERDYEKRQMGSYNMGGKIEKYQAGGMPKSRDGMCSQGQTRAAGQTGTRS
jgi:hypothetical protein